ncbi:hypothetical protein B0H17DRAFT_1183948, partial [Mycena rosella]
MSLSGIKAVKISQWCIMLHSLYALGLLPGPGEQINLGSYIKWHPHALVILLTNFPWTQMVSKSVLKIGITAWDASMPSNLERFLEIFDRAVKYPEQTGTYFNSTLSQLEICFASTPISIIAASDAFCEAFRTMSFRMMCKYLVHLQPAVARGLVSVVRDRGFIHSGTCFHRNTSLLDGDGILQGVANDLVLTMSLLTLSRMECTFVAGACTLTGTEISPLLAAATDFTTVDTCTVATVTVTTGLLRCLGHGHDELMLNFLVAKISTVTVKIGLVALPKPAYGVTHSNHTTANEHEESAVQSEKNMQKDFETAATRDMLVISVCPEMLESPSFARQLG